MTLTIRASKGSESIEAPRNSPIVAVAYARALFKAGWNVVITDDEGRHHAPARFDQLLAFDPPVKSHRSPDEASDTLNNVDNDPSSGRLIKPRSIAVAVRSIGGVQFKRETFRSTTPPQRIIFAGRRCLAPRQVMQLPKYRRYGMVRFQVCGRERFSHWAKRLTRLGEK